MQLSKKYIVPVLFSDALPWLNDEKGREKDELIKPINGTHHSLQLFYYSSYIKK